MGLLNRSVEPCGVRESAGDIAGRVMASGPVASRAATPRVESPTIRYRIATRAEIILRVCGNPQANTDLLDEFVRVHGETQNLRRGSGEETASAPKRLGVQVGCFGGVGCG